LFILKNYSKRWYYRHSNNSTAKDQAKEKKDGKRGFKDSSEKKRYKSLLGLARFTPLREKRETVKAR
jgi:hypothetical protein